MFYFIKRGERLIAAYESLQSSSDWLYEKLESDGYYTFSKTFTFSRDDLIRNSADIEDNEFNISELVYFEFGNLTGEYYKIKRGILANKYDIYIHHSINLSHKYFTTYKLVSHFRLMDKIISQDVYIGGQEDNSISDESYKELLKTFPNDHEVLLYLRARISKSLKDYFSTTQDNEGYFQKYLNKKIKAKKSNILETFKDNELYKFEILHEKLTSLLENENAYSESEWQNEIIQIIQLLYPKYLHVFKNVKIRGSKNEKRYLDFLLVDSNGNIDIVEIKKPFDNSIVSPNKYRDNHIPMRELSGAVMQIEKYLYYLNRWSREGEIELSNRFKNELPDGFRLNITNPSGIIIMGRDNNLNEEQKSDFEVVKRKYKNIIDIITYDSLLTRLQFIIKTLRKN
jgi:hypothetical protein